MHLTRTLSLSLLSFTALAASHESSWHPEPQKCLSDTDATFLADIFLSFSVSFDPNYAGQFLDDDFTIQSDSVNIFSNGVIPLGSLTAPNKTAFLEGALASTTTMKQAPATVENVIHGCHDLAFRYVTADTPPIQGIQILYTQKDTNLIEKAYAEFNNVADLIGRGLFPCKTC